MTTATQDRESLGARIRGIDEKLGSLRPRLATLREDVAKLIEKENRHVRLYADADQRDKKKIDKLLTETVEQRASLERECKGLAISLAELEASRAELYPDYQKLMEEEHRQARRIKIEDLRKQHERDQLAEQKADAALAEARERTNRSFFNWRSALDQEIVDAQTTALNEQKENWARISGPNVAKQSRMN
jgi:hypothetical protein